MLVTHLMKVTADAKGDNWDDQIDPILFGYRVKVQSSTKFSPFELLYGTRARLPVELEGVGDEADSLPDASAIDERMTYLASQCAAALDVVIRGWETSWLIGIKARTSYTSASAKVCTVSVVATRPEANCQRCQFETLQRTGLPKQ